MSEAWQPTRAVRILVESAEVQIIGHAGAPELVANGSLINIARGSASIRFKVSAVPVAGGVGHLTIEGHRPLMHGDILLPAAQFDRILTLFQSGLPRPATLVLALRERLQVSDDGALSIEATLTCTVTDISWVLPLL